MWIYKIFEDVIGVVKANTREEAEAKVREAYLYHCNEFNEDEPITIKSKDEEGNWFADCPDVIEVFG